MTASFSARCSYKLKKVSQNSNSYKVLQQTKQQTFFCQKKEGILEPNFTKSERKVRFRQYIFLKNDSLDELKFKCHREKKLDLFRKMVENTKIF